MARKQTGLRGQMTRAMSELRRGRGRRKTGLAHGAAEEIRKRFLSGAGTGRRTAPTRRHTRTKS